MGWRLNFHFPSHPKIILSAFVTANGVEEAKEKFKSDYPNLADCEIIDVVCVQE